jgi:hypothetical protein
MPKLLAAQTEVGDYAHYARRLWRGAICAKNKLSKNIAQRLAKRQL